MSLSRKGRRLLHVEGVDYVWAASEQEATVELAGAPSGRLVIASGQALTPAAVARAIQCARAQGWDPAAPGRSFRLAGRRGLLAPDGR